MFPERGYELYFEMSTCVVRAGHKVVVLFILTTCTAIWTFAFCLTMEDMTSGKGTMDPSNVKSEAVSVREAETAKERPIDDVQRWPLVRFNNPLTELRFMGMTA